MYILVLAVISALSIQAFSEEIWTNAIGNQSCHPSIYQEPKTLADLCKSVKNAVSQDLKIRAIGRGYSISDIGCTNGCLLNLRHLNHILSVDLEQKTVRVEAGIVLRDFNKTLATYNLSLSNQPAIDQISLGGAISTAVHGTGHTGTLSSFIKEIELITADGNILKLSPHSDPDFFAAVSTSIGTLGVIYSVTLQCEPLFYIKETNNTADIESVLTNYKRLHHSHDFCQFFWNVDTGATSIIAWDRVDKKDSNSKASYQALPWYTIDPTDEDLFSEIAVPIDALPNALHKLQELLKKYKAMGAQITDVTIRFVDQDKNSYLSPSFDGPCAYIALCVLEKDKYLDFYKEFECVARIHHGRPHWGKLNFLEFEEVKLLYGSNLEKFINIKQKLDPDGVFSNSFSHRILGL